MASSCVVRHQEHSSERFFEHSWLLNPEGYQGRSPWLVRATNVSGKGIVFMLVRFREGGTRGGGIDQIIQWDNFFWNEEIAPDETFVLDRSRGGFQTKCCINPLESGVNL